MVPVRLLAPFQHVPDAVCHVVCDMAVGDDRRVLLPQGFVAGLHPGIVPHGDRGHVHHDPGKVAVGGLLHAAVSGGAAGLVYPGAQAHERGLLVVQEPFHAADRYGHQQGAERVKPRQAHDNTGVLTLVCGLGDHALQQRYLSVDMPDGTDVLRHEHHVAGPQLQQVQIRLVPLA